jgi:hypothetical protein
MRVIISESNSELEQAKVPNKQRLKKQEEEEEEEEFTSLTLLRTNQAIQSLPSNSPFYTSSTAVGYVSRYVM